MAGIEYIVTLGHKDKGPGYTAKTALQNAARQKKSLIKKAGFEGQPTSASTGLRVVVDDIQLKETITQVLESSGRMPKSGWDIKSITLTESSAEDIRALQSENEALKTQLRSTPQPKSITASTPLEGLLAYFESRTYTPETILERPEDLLFAKKVLRGEMQNTLPEYISHVTGERLTEEEIQEALDLPQTSPDATLKAAYEEAQRELEYLRKVEAGETDIPPTLQAGVIEAIKSKKHEKTIAAYEREKASYEEKERKQETYQELQQKYTTFIENLQLTQAGAELPVIFNKTDNGPAMLEIYFPFKKRDMKAGFIEDLQKELTEYFTANGGGVVEEKKQTMFVAFRVRDASDITPDGLLDEIPITLRIAGFSEICPYTLGRIQ
ncbi:hypothetical protein KY329_04275 [Candidatus Woesearchaeota archaeon]|nr:hypothetical protein [Candidatus Woesearchaeota archaeon]